MSGAVPFGVVALAVFCRIGGCFLVMPGLSSGRVPAQVRILAVLGLAIALAPGLALEPPEIADGFALVRLIGVETIVGAFFGLAARFHLLAFSFGAQVIAAVIGFSAIPGIAVADDGPSAPLATLVTFSALIVLFQLDFHHQVLRALVLSYEMLPVAGSLRTGALLNDLLATLALSFEIALRLAAPFIAYGLVANVAIGLVNKLAMQIPVYFVSLPFLIAGGLILFYFLVPTMLRVFAASFDALPAFR